MWPISNAEGNATGTPKSSKDEEMGGDLGEHQARGIFNRSTVRALRGGKYIFGRSGVTVLVQEPSDRIRNHIFIRLS